MIGFHAIGKTTVLFRILPEAEAETKVQGQAAGHEVNTDGEVRQGKDRALGGVPKAGVTVGPKLIATEELH